VKALAVTPAQRRIDLVEHPDPAPSAADDVLLRVLRVGICGTDREICAFDYGTPPAGEQYLVLGHESLAEVVSAGPAAAGFAPGQLVVPMVRRPCADPACDACRAGRQDFCVTGGYTERGIKGAHGFMTERVVDAARWLVPVPAELRDVGVLVEPLTIAEKALLEVRRVMDRMPWRGEDLAGLHAVVLGGGPVGLLGAMALRVAGCRVTLVSRQPAADMRAGCSSRSAGATSPARSRRWERSSPRSGAWTWSTRRWARRSRRSRRSRCWGRTRCSCSPAFPGAAVLRTWTAAC
jgi:threonine dehydrogenase-like Zn-dependent dehydrogenase